MPTMTAHVSNHATAASPAFRFEKQVSANVAQPVKSGRPRSFTNMTTKKNTLPPVPTSFVSRSTHTAIHQPPPPPLVFSGHGYSYPVPMNSANTVAASPAPAPGTTRRHHIPPLSAAGLPLSASTPASTMSYASPMTSNTVYVHPRFITTPSAYQAQYQQQQQYQAGPNTGSEAIPSVSPPSDHSVAYYQSGRTYHVYPANGRKRTSVAMPHTSTGVYFAQPPPASLHQSLPPSQAQYQRRRGSEMSSMKVAYPYGQHSPAHHDGSVNSSYQPRMMDSKRTGLEMEAQPISSQKRNIEVASPDETDRTNHLRKSQRRSSQQSTAGQRRTVSQASSYSEGRTAHLASGASTPANSMEVYIKEEEVPLDFAAITKTPIAAAQTDVEIVGAPSPPSSADLTATALGSSALETNNTGNAAKAITENIRALQNSSGPQVVTIRSSSMPLGSSVSSLISTLPLESQRSMSLPPLHTPDSAETARFSSKTLRQEYNSSSESSLSSDRSPTTPPSVDTTALLPAGLAGLQKSVDREKEHRLASEKRRNAIADESILQQKKRKATVDMSISPVSGSRLARPNSRLADRRGNLASEKARNLSITTSQAAQRCHRQFPVAVQTAPMQHSFTFPPAPSSATPAISRAMQAVQTTSTPRRATFSQAGLEQSYVTAAAHPYGGLATSHHPQPMYHIPPIPQYHQQVYHHRHHPQQQYQPQAQYVQARPPMPMTAYPSPPRQISKADFLTAMEHIYDALPDTGAAQQHLYQVIEEARSTVLGEEKTRAEWEQRMDHRLEHFKGSVSKEMLLLEKKIESLQKVEKTDSGLGEEQMAEDHRNANAVEESETSLRRPTSNLRGC